MGREKNVYGTGWDLFRIIARDFLFCPNCDTKKKKWKEREKILNITTDRAL